MGSASLSHIRGVSACPRFPWPASVALGGNRLCHHSACADAGGPPHCRRSGSACRSGSRTLPRGRWSEFVQVALVAALSSATRAVCYFTTQLVGGALVCLEWTAEVKAVCACWCPRFLPNAISWCVSTSAFVPRYGGASSVRAIRVVQPPWTCHCVVRADVSQLAVRMLQGKSHSRMHFFFY